ncbi:MAG: recombinase family protein [Thermomicrobiales bacterium]
MSEASTTAIYVRVSGSLQEKEGASLETQEAACRSMLATSGYTASAPRLYRETHTGIDLFERPVLSELRGAIRRGEIRLVVVYDLDRLSRDAAHLGVLFTEAKYYGADYQFVLGEYEDSPEGEAIRFIKGMSGKIEHERIRDKSRRGHRGRVENGLLPVGPRPQYGYRWIEGIGPKGKLTKLRLEPDPETAPIVIRMFEEIATGRSARKVAADLTAEGVPSPTNRGNPWTGQTITKLLREPVYTGKKQVLRTENFYEQVPGVGRKTRHRIKDTPAEPRDPDIAPSLVSPELAAAAIAQLGRNKTYAVRNNRNPELSLLRGGIARCGYCNRALTVQNVRGFLHYGCCQQRRYGCPYHAISVTELDAQVWQQVREIVTNPDIVKLELERQRVSDPTVGDLESVERRLGELRRKQVNLVKRLATVDDMVADLVQQELAVLTEQVRPLERERETLLAIRTGWMHSEEQLTGLTEWCDKVADELDNLTYDEKRMALTALGISARLWKSDHEPRFDITARLEFLPIVESTASSSPSPTTNASNSRRVSCGAWMAAFRSSSPPATTARGSPPSAAAAPRTRVRQWS